MTTATFTMLRPGREFIVKPGMRKYLGFSRGKIIRLISTWDNMAKNGGSYTVQRLDGAADSLDLTPDIHRSFIIPTSPKMLERLKRREAKKA